jgi:hypothetical protein
MRFHAVAHAQSECMPWPRSYCNNLPHYVPFTLTNLCLHLVPWLRFAVICQPRSAEFNPLQPFADDLNRPFAAVLNGKIKLSPFSGPRGM